MPDGHELSWTQPMVFESMRIACEKGGQKSDVILLSSSFKEDREYAPSVFKRTEDLTESVQDFGPFKDKRKLPLIREVLQKAYEFSQDGDYLIYTNSDIVVLPHFYDAIERTILKESCDAMVINRRRIGLEYQKLEDLPLVWAELGKSHPGFDCFVFKRELFPKMSFGNICIGVPFIGVSLAHNLFALAEKPQYLDGLHLTVHMGMEVTPNRPKDTYFHNRNEFKNVNAALKPNYKLERFPYASLNPVTRTIKWGLNPSLSVKLGTELQGKSWFEKLKYRINEIRWRVLHR
jgi:hypothetical protein